MTEGGQRSRRNLALCQILERGYAERYRNLLGKKVWEVGLVFSKAERNLIAFDYEEVAPKQKES